MMGQLKAPQRSKFVELTLRDYALVSGILIFFSFALTYIMTFYFSFHTDRALLYTSVDPGYVSPGFEDKPIFGVHFFGDLLTQLGFANNPSPYAITSSFPAPYPPFGLVVFKPLLGLPTKVSILMVSVLTISLLVYAFNKVLREESLLVRIAAIVLILLASKPFLLTLDRGNIQGLVLGSMVLSLYYLRQNREYVGANWLIFAISLKAYPILLLIGFLQRKKLKAIFYVIGMSILVTLVSSVIISPSKPFAFIVGWLKGLGVQSGSNTSGLSFGSYIFRMVDATNIVHVKLGHNLTFIFTSAIIALACTALMTWNYLQKRVFKDIDDLILIGLTTFLTPVSWTYNAIWVPFLIVTLISHQKALIGESYLKKRYRNITFILIVISIPIPWIWRGHGYISVSLFELLLPPVYLVLLLYRLKESRELTSRD